MSNAMTTKALKFKQKSSAEARDEFLAYIGHEHIKYCGPPDMQNPRNWSPAKKRLLFAALISSSLLADGAMTWGATLIVTQAQDWGISVDYSSTSMNYGILLQGFGGIFAVPFIEAYGRLPIWFWTQVITMFMVVGATLSTSWSMFTTFRSLQGLFGTVPQVVGLSIIHDMYEPEDWPRMINIWATTFLVGPFVGPALAGYILAACRNQWNISFGVLAALYGLSTFLILLFGYETYYSENQHHPDSINQQDQHPAISRIYSFLGINNFSASEKRGILLAESSTLLQFIFKLPLLLPGISVMINFCWPIGITTTVDTFLHAPPYSFDNIQASSMRFAGVIGASSGYIFGHIFNEWIYRRHHNKKQSLNGKSQLSSKNKNKKDQAISNNHNGSNAFAGLASESGTLNIADTLILSVSDESFTASALSLSSSSPTWRPEYRLHGVWIPIASLACGLVTYGLTLNYNKSWVGLAFGWVMVNLGMVGSMVAITAYALEKYPTHSTIVSAIINMWRTCGGFSVGYFQDKWIQRNGVGVVFGIQAAVVVVGVVLTIVPVFVLARSRRQGQTN